MEFGTIKREVYVDASPEIVFEVVSSPDHIKGWWPDDASYELVPGAVGEIAFGDVGSGRKQETLTVLEVQPPRSFTFRWIHPVDEVAATGNSLLVTFDLTPSGAGTKVTMTETGFREMGWEAAVLEEAYKDHANGWDYFMPRLAPYAESLAARP